MKTKGRIQKVSQWCVVASVAASLNACHAEQGRVVNEVTGKPIVGSLVWSESGWHTPITYEVLGKPIAGAQIVGYWTGKVLNPGPEPSSLRCYRVTATASDAKGNFVIPAFSGNFNPLLQGRLRIVDVVARGFRPSRNTDSARLFYAMRPLADPKVDPDGARKDFEYFSRNPGISCGDEKLLLEYLKVRHYNLALLATSEEDKSDLHNSLFGIDIIEFGERVAEQNSVARSLEYSAVRLKEAGKMKQDKGSQK